MNKIRSYAELIQLYDRVRPLLNNRLNLKGAAEVDLIGARKERRKVLVCGGTGCQASDSQKIIAEFKKLLQEKKLEDVVDVSATGCFGFCEKGPIVKIFPDDVIFRPGETGRCACNCGAASAMRH
jgi:NADH-quinone oxidoreductase subunit F